ncbi:C40 family peptidase [Streptomyces sp. 8K308]|uniref:C40 family peptidase n=1 Tax=Streptomyces sp. 8K308 TaxID=2530388 RepID=UPI001FB752EE|nr:C40 family peptidase [Streptomyces sp. 8K308]
MRRTVIALMGALLALLLVCLLLIAGSTDASSTAAGCAPSRQSEGAADGGRWSPEQTRNATTITEIARARSLSQRAAVIAVAVAIQESSLVNLAHGDRDSVGLFQQRPSQGWGTREQLTDPPYAAGRFYDALLAVDGWETRPLADVAQAVQRSAYPEAYARWEEPAGALVSAAWSAGATTTTATACTDYGADAAVDFDVENPRTPAQAIAAARRAVGQTGWYRRCDAFVAQAYGYLNSGSRTANEHWARLRDAGLTHPGDHSPPPGALLFYDTGQAAGHVTLYLGDDQVASNDILDAFEGQGRIALVNRDDLTAGRWRLHYRGWAAPSFPGAGGRSTI